MGKGLQMMFKALGVEIAPEHIAMIQALIPQLPAKINEAAQAINQALANFDARLRALEQKQEYLHAAQKDTMEAIQVLRHDIFALANQQMKELQEVLHGRTEPESIGAGRRGRTRSGAGASGDGAGNGGGSNDAGG